MSAREQQTDNSDKYRWFSLKRLLIAFGLLGMPVGFGGWLYYGFIYAVPLTAEDDLAAYVDRRVSFAGAFEDTGKGDPSEFVYFGDEPVGFFWSGSGRPKNGQSIVVTGLLRTAERRHWHRIKRQRIAYCLYGTSWHAKQPAE